MEQEEIKKSIIERFNSLQPEIQTAIMNSDYENNISIIGRKYNLTDEQVSELEFNTTLVLLGQTHPDNYKVELSEDIKLSEDKISEIVNDINEIILKPIRETLKNNFADDDRKESELMEIPLPPYKSPEAVAEIMPQNVEKKEVETKIEIPLIDFPKKEEVIPAKPPTNIIEEKLKGATQSENTVSDHSASSARDPYREEF